MSPGDLLLALVQRAVLHPLSHLVPRRVDRWAFGAPQDAFAGNPKYLFLWMAEHRPDVRCTWLTGSPATRDLLRAHGHAAELRWSWAGVRSAARAGWHVVGNDASDTNLALTGGARLLNTWHGVGIKRILRGARVGANARLLRQVEQWWRPDVRLRSGHRFRRPELVLATSPAMAEHFARSFDIPVERCPQTGYPRLDPLVDEGFRRTCLAYGDDGELRRLRAGRRLYLYAPTLRDDDATALAEALPDLAALSAALRPTDGLLLLKLHPVTAARLGGQLPDLQALDNIALWPSGLDLYPVLDQVDCLVTDYSSLLYDHIAVRSSGVVVYAYDHDRYVAVDRDLTMPFDDNVVGVRAGTFAELCGAIASGAALAALDADRLAQLRERFWGSPGPVRELASPAVVHAVLARPAGGRIRRR